MVNYQISYPMEFHGLDIMGTNVIRRKVKKGNLQLKSVTMVDPVTRWFEVIRYDEKREILKLRGCLDILDQ